MYIVLAMALRRVIGIDAGGTKLLGAVVDEELVVADRVHRSWRGEDRADLLETIVDAVAEVRAAAPDVEAAGFGIPALVDHARGISELSVHLPLDGVPFQDFMSERLGLEVHVDNDANAALLAEHRYGAARGIADAILLTIGTGVGGALLLDGRLYRGGSGFAGELGHMVVDIDGPLCSGGCSNRGCLETLVSGPAIARAGNDAAARAPGSALAAALLAGRAITGPLVTELAHGGDAAARAVIEGVGTSLGAGLSSLVNIFNPELIVIGGGVIGAGDLLLDPARRVVAERALSPSARAVRIVAAAFGPEAGVLGAALLAFDGGRS